MPSTKVTCSRWVMSIPKSAVGGCSGVYCSRCRRQKVTRYISLWSFSNCWKMPKRKKQDRILYTIQTCSLAWNTAILFRIFRMSTTILKSVIKYIRPARSITDAKIMRLRRCRHVALREEVFRLTCIIRSMISRSYQNSKTVARNERRSFSRKLSLILEIHTMMRENWCNAVSIPLWKM